MNPRRIFIFIAGLILSSILFSSAYSATKKGKPLVSIERHDSIIVYYPNYSRIDLATGTMPSMSERSIIFMCSGAFTGERLEEFKHSNIAGHHVSSGKFYQGYKCSPNNGVFTWSPQKGGKFFNYSHKNSEDPLKVAAQEGGMGYCQSLLFLNGKQFKGCFKADLSNQYRALCEIDGKLCIIDCTRSLPFGNFLSALKKIGVKNAIYCDMGGWSYSWYRQDDGRVKTLFSSPSKYATNWIVFYGDVE